MCNCLFDRGRKIVRKETVLRMKNAGSKRLNGIIKFFSICYSVISAFLIIYTWITGKVVIGGTDGINQHYRAMVYISNLYRQLIGSIIHGKISIPMYDYTIGMGDDILTTLNYYGLGDPLYLLTVFVSPRYMPYFYTLFFYFRIYLAGVSLIIFLERILPNRDKKSYVAAAFVYCFSGFALESNCHIIFVHAMMYLPLILWAIKGCFDKIENSKCALAIFVAMLACTNVYFFYIISIISAIFTLYNIVSNKTNRVAVFKIAACYIGGALSAAIILLPVVLAIMESNRQSAVSAQEYIRPLYSYTEYKELFYRLFYVTDSVRGMAAIPIIGLISMVIVLMTRRNRGLIIAIIAGIVSYITPIVAWIMSGMGGNVYGRWEIVLTLIGAACVVEAWDDIVHIEKKGVVVIWLFFFVMLFIGFIDHTALERCYRNSLLGCVVCNLVITYVFTISKKTETYKRNAILLVSIMCASLTWITNVINYNISSITDYSGVISRINAKDEMYRIDFERAYNFTENIMNLSLTDRFLSTTEYFSIDNPGYISGRYRMGLGDSYLIAGFDNRSILQSLASVKYIIADKSDAFVPPYGFFVNNEMEDDDYLIYENKYAFPLVYSYDEEMSYDSYALLDPLEKQVAISEYVAYRGVESNITPDTSRYIGDSEDGYELSSESDESGNHYDLVLNCKENKETYVLLGNGSFKGNVSINGYVKKIWGRDVNTINLGYYDSDTVVRVQFDSTDVIEKNDISIKQLDVSSVFENCLSRIHREDDLAIENNEVICKTDHAGDRVVCVSIPYTKGWKAYVDDKEIDTFSVNDLFLGIRIPKGTHNIVFQYTTPGLRIGALISVCSIVCFVLFYVLRKKENA